ncbi:hypothetical protein G6F62_013625 [Rhizopus arrhizus]|nr:hypothetical protein G6F62_013625 [Rhizopus arrhizus]
MRPGRAPGTVLLLTLTLALASGCQPGSPPAPTAAQDAAATPAPSQAPSPPLVAAARAQIGVTVRYDPAYQPGPGSAGTRA